MAATQRGLEGLGYATHKAFTDTTPANIVGDRVNRALKAALKATVPGAQSDKQMDLLLTRARKAFARQLRRSAL
jgi:hypothetical protein